MKFETWKESFGNRLTKIEQRQDDLAEVLVDIRDNHLNTITERLDGLAARMDARPTWTTTYILTTLAAVVVALVSIIGSLLAK